MFLLQSRTKMHVLQINYNLFLKCYKSFFFLHAFIKINMCYFLLPGCLFKWVNDGILRPVTQIRASEGSSWRRATNGDGVKKRGGGIITFLAQTLWFRGAVDNGFLRSSPPPTLLVHWEGRALTAHKCKELQPHGGWVGGGWVDGLL